MKSAGIFRGMVMCLAALGVCLSGAAIAAPPAASPVVHDVALASGGVLQGQVVDAQGVPAVGADVALLLEQRSLGVAKTDARGRFLFRGVRGGVYQLAAGDGAGNFRVWASGTEPKGTPAVAQVIAGGPVVRGQYYNYGHGYYTGYSSHLGRAKYLLANPWVVSGIVATAVAVPVGIHNAGSGDAPASP